MRKEEGGKEKKRRKSSKRQTKGRGGGTAHDLTALAYSEALYLILTASTDGRSRLWTANGVRIGEFGQTRPWQMHRWHTYAQRMPDHVDIFDESDEEQVGEGGSGSPGFAGGMDVVGMTLKDDNEIDNEGAYYLEQQRMNFFGVGRKDKDMRR